MPKISILLVNYNHAKYLDERIQSILNQTYKDFEFLIIDNGSTDNSQEVISKYKEDPRVKLYFYADNMSPYRRWNDAADMAQGEYLHIICADDSCHPTLLEKLAEKLDQHPDVGFAYSNAWEIDSNSNKVRSAKYWTDEVNTTRWTQDFIDSGKNECYYFFFKCFIINIGAVLMRHQLFIDSGKFDLEMPFSADWLLYSKMLMNSDVAFIAEPLNYFRANTTVFYCKEDLFLETKVRILNYLCKNLPRPKNFDEKTYAPTIGSWMRLMASNQLSVGMSLKIYKLMQEINPNINYFLIQYFLNVFKRKILSIFHNTNLSPEMK